MFFPNGISARQVVILITYFTVDKLNMEKYEMKQFKILNVNYANVQLFRIFEIF